MKFNTHKKSLIFEPVKLNSSLDKPALSYILIVFLLLLSGCISQFIPEVNEIQEMLVVEGIITDQPQTSSVKLSLSLPLGKKSEARPLGGCIVTIVDDDGNQVALTETNSGTYVPPSYFHGEIGRSYTLHIISSRGSGKTNYESTPMVMKPVPPIDSIYYEKKVIRESYEDWFGIDACQIYLDTYDPKNSCRFYRWSFSETWVLRLLFPVPNIQCWITENTDKINIKTTASLGEGRIIHHPINYISNITDRLKVRYSILVNQYSLNEDEFGYWEKVQNFIDQSGGLYDIIPSSIPGNIWCISNPNENVLGFFSVSAVSSKRIYIQDKFSGIIDQYPNCIADTIYGDYDPPELYLSAWTLIDHPAERGPRERVLTYRKECADCTTRGTNIKPDFWTDDN